jgi:hypothetical protein|tara:strand:- start:1721 stop:1936 length:216 start_codon:yes stop_codon:yes gene_type:complete
MDSLRKSHITDLLSSAIKDNPDLRVMEILRAVFRVKNYKNTGSAEKFFLHATDEQLSRVLEDTVRDLKENK